MSVESRQREFEGIGMIALVGALLLPGVYWIVRGKSTAAIVGRSVVVGTVVVAAAVFEGTVDSTAEKLVGSLQGSTV